MVLETLKMLLFEFVEKFGLKFSLKLFYNENLHYLLCSCTSPIFRKKIVLEKLFSFSEMAGFFNEPDLQNKSMK